MEVVTYSPEKAHESISLHGKHILFHGQEGVVVLGGEPTASVSISLRTIKGPHPLNWFDTKMGRKLTHMWEKLSGRPEQLIYTANDMTYYFGQDPQTHTPFLKTGQEKAFLTQPQPMNTKTAELYAQAVAENGDKNSLNTSFTEAGALALRLIDAWNATVSTAPEDSWGEHFLPRVQLMRNQIMDVLTILGKTREEFIRAHHLPSFFGSVEHLDTDRTEVYMRKLVAREQYGRLRKEGSPLCVATVDQKKDAVTLRYPGKISITYTPDKMVLHRPGNKQLDIKPQEYALYPFLDTLSIETFLPLLRDVEAFVTSPEVRADKEHDVERFAHVIPMIIQGLTERKLILKTHPGSEELAFVQEIPLGKRRPVRREKQRQENQNTSKEPALSLFGATLRPDPFDERGIQIVRGTTVLRQLQLLPTQEVSRVLIKQENEVPMRMEVRSNGDVRLSASNVLLPFYFAVQTDNFLRREEEYGFPSQMADIIEHGIQGALQKRLEEALQESLSDVDIVTTAQRNENNEQCIILKPKSAHGINQVVVRRKEDLGEMEISFIQDDMRLTLGFDAHGNSNIAIQNKTMEDTLPVIWENEAAVIAGKVVGSLHRIVRLHLEKLLAPELANFLAGNTVNISVTQKILEGLDFIRSVEGFVSYGKTMLPPGKLLASPLGPIDRLSRLFSQRKTDAADLWTLAEEVA